MITPTSSDERLTSATDDDLVLEIEGVSKKFCRSLKRSLFYGVQDIASELVGTRPTNNDLRQGEFWALHDVKLQLRRGEAIGLIGANGSGKTTLLRIISGLIRPDTGSVRVKGRVAPLIALGAGFNPILTGRENIYVNMSILGLSDQKIKQLYDAVVDFAEIGDAINAPLHSYSSGMAARLGFACAIYTQPDVLLIDEVLAVGDTKFRGKCFRQLNELRQNGTSFILVSHSPNQILTVCQSALYLRQGEIVVFGETTAVMTRYEQDLFLGGVPQGKESAFFSRAIVDSSSGLLIDSIFFRNDRGDILETPLTGEPTSLCIQCQVFKEIEDVYFTVVIDAVASAGETVLNLNSYKDQQALHLSVGKHEVQVQMPYLGLNLGIYSMNIYAHQGPLYNLDSVEGFRFTVQSQQSIGRSLFYQPRVWNLASRLQSLN